MTRKTAPALYLCGITPDSARTATLATNGQGCEFESSHAPMPAGYLDFHDIADRRLAAGQVSKRCDGCGLFMVWSGGRAVAGWPRTTAGLRR